MYKLARRILSRSLLLSFLFGAFFHRVSWSYASPDSISIADNSVPGTSQEVPPTYSQLSPLAKQRGLAQERAAQNILPHTWHNTNLSSYPTGRHRLRTSPQVSPVSEQLSFQARGGEQVRFHYELGQWRAEVLSRIGNFARQSVLPVVCSQGEDVASSLEVLNNYPSWYSQRQIHVIGRNVLPVLGKIVYLGVSGLKGGGGGEASGSGAGKEECEREYDNTTFENLARVSNRQDHLLKVVFHDPSSPETSFVNQFKQLKILLNALEKAGALFISPVSPDSPYLLGMLYRSNLILLSPTEVTQFQERALSEIKQQNLVEELCISNPLIGQAGESSYAGPIVAELMLHYSQLSEEGFDLAVSQLYSLGAAWQESIPDQASEQSPYKTIDVSSLLPQSLSSLGQSESSSPGSTGEVLTKLRQSHVSILSEVSDSTALVSGVPIYLLQESPHYRKLQKESILSLKTSSYQGVNKLSKGKGISEVKRKLPGIPDPAQGPSSSQRSSNSKLVQRAESLHPAGSVAPLPKRQALGSTLLTSDLGESEGASSNRDLSQAQALAQQLLSEDENAQKSVREFLSEHKYTKQHAGTLSSLAREVSKTTGVEGIQALLRHMESDKEIVGVQHLLVQLRVTHEWLCIADEGVAKNIAKAAFQVISSLQRWFRRGLKHVQKKEYNAGHKLLELLTSSLQTFSAVTSHTPELLQPLINAARDPNADVRRAAIAALGKVTEAVPKETPGILQLLTDNTQYPDPDVQEAAIETLGKVAQVAPDKAPAIIKILEQAASREQDKNARQAAIEALGQVAQVAPGKVQNIIKILKKAVEDQGEYTDVRQAAIEALGKMAKAASDKARAITNILKEAAKDCDENVRQAAIETLEKVAQVAPDKASAIIEILEEAANHEQDGNLQHKEGARQAAIKVLGRVAQVAPQEVTQIINILKEVAQDQQWEGRPAAIEALGEVAEATPEEATHIINTLKEAAAECRLDVKQAAIRALGKAFKAAPSHGPGIIHTLRQAACDSDENTRPTATTAIETLGEVFKDAPSHAQTIIPMLIQATQSPSTLRAAIYALSKVAQADPSKAPAIIPSLIKATEDQQWSASQAAIEKLEKVSLQQLLECYWAREDRQDPRLIPHITTRLYHTSLVAKSPVQNQQQVVLYATEDNPQTWHKSKEVVQRFVNFIKAEVDPAEKTLEYYRQYLAMVQVLRPGDHPDVARALNNVGVAHEYLGNHAEALQYKRQALERRQAYHHGNHPDRAASLNNVGIAYHDLGQYDEALRHYLQALAMRQALDQGNYPQTTQVVGHMEAIDHISNNAEQALEHHGPALTMRQTLDEGNLSPIDQPLNSVEILTYALGSPDQVLEHCEPTLTMQQDIYTGNHPLYQSFSNLGAAHYALGNYNQALEYFNLALEIRRQPRFRGSHPQAASFLDNAGTACHALGNYEQALKYFNLALTMRQAIYQRNHSRVASSLDNVGMVYINWGNYELARDYFDQAIEKRKAYYGEQHTRVADSLANVGAVYMNSGRYKQAREHFEQALEMYQSPYGNNHLAVAQALNNVGIVYEKLENYARALEMRQALYESQYSQVAKALKKVGADYMKSEKYEQALGHLEAALTMYQVLHPGTYPELARTLNDTTGVYKNSDNCEQASGHSGPPVFKLYLLYAGNYTEVAWMLCKIGESHEKLGNHDRAREYHEQVSEANGALRKVADTLENVVGAAYRELGSDDRARECQEQAREMRKALPKEPSMQG
ncbi:MAG: tetratricopeptide repeat protein [Bacteroidota bacterium]